jgi:hypothetical protein
MKQTKPDRRIVSEEDRFCPKCKYILEWSDNLQSCWCKNEECTFGKKRLTMRF